MTIRYIHIRQVDSRTADEVLNSSGGLTIAYMMETPEKITFHWSQCCQTDNFCKRLAREIAGGRLRKFKPDDPYKPSTEIAHKQGLARDTIIEHIAEWFFPGRIKIWRNSKGRLVSDFNMELREISE